MNEALNRIYNMDCIEGMERLYKKYGECLDLVVTDCPYKTISGGARKNKKGNETSGILNRSTSKESRLGTFFSFNNIKFSEWVPHVYNLLKDGTHFYVMVNDKNVREMLNVCVESGFKEVNILAWKKNNCTPNQFYMKNMEFILMFRKGKARHINEMGSKQFFEIDNIKGTKLHPSEKPVELMEHLIRNSTNENEIVLDPFMGSGTTAIAAINTNRNFIGFELDKQYYEIANQRIVDHLKG